MLKCAAWEEGKTPTAEALPEVSLGADLTTWFQDHWLADLPEAEPRSHSPSVHQENSTARASQPSSLGAPCSPSDHLPSSSSAGPASNVLLGAGGPAPWQDGASKLPTQRSETAESQLQLLHRLTSLSSQLHPQLLQPQQPDGWQSRNGGELGARQPSASSCSSDLAPSGPSIILPSQQQQGGPFGQAGQSAQPAPLSTSWGPQQGGPEGELHQLGRQQGRGEGRLHQELLKAGSGQEEALCMKRGRGEQLDQQTLGEQGGPEGKLKCPVQEGGKQQQQQQQQQPLLALLVQQLVAAKQQGGGAGEARQVGEQAAPPTALLCLLRLCREACQREASAAARATLLERYWQLKYLQLKSEVGGRVQPPVQPSSQQGQQQGQALRRVATAGALPSLAALGLAPEPGRLRRILSWGGGDGAGSRAGSRVQSWERLAALALGRGAAASKAQPLGAPAALGLGRDAAGSQVQPLVAPVGLSLERDSPAGSWRQEQPYSALETESTMPEAKRPRTEAREVPPTGHSWRRQCTELFPRQYNSVPPTPQQYTNVLPPLRQDTAEVLLRQYTEVLLQESQQLQVELAQLQGALESSLTAP